MAFFSSFFSWRSSFFSSRVKALSRVIFCLTGAEGDLEDVVLAAVFLVVFAVEAEGAAAAPPEKEVEGVATLPSSSAAIIEKSSSIDDVTVASPSRAIPVKESSASTS